MIMSGCVPRVNDNGEGADSNASQLIHLTLRNFESRDFSFGYPDVRHGHIAASGHGLSLAVSLIAECA